MFPLLQMKMKGQPGTRLNKKVMKEFEAFAFKLFFKIFCKQFPWLFLVFALLYDHIRYGSLCTVWEEVLNFDRTWSG